MIDTLYPIMGGMISKYVATALKELMETISDKIDDGLSLERIKRKIKSKATGVSEAELLLQKSSETLISSLFVIHKKSGLLVSAAHIKEKKINDPHMIASMASAIKDFINDWIQSNEKQSEIQLLSYGSATLYIESAGSLYLIAVLDAEPNHEQRSEINRFFATLVRKYANFFQNFDGDDSSKEVFALTKRLQDYLDMQKKLTDLPVKKSKSIRYFIFLMMTALLIGMAYWFKNMLFEYQIESSIKNKTGCTVDIDQNDGGLVASGTVYSFSDLYAIEGIIRQRSQQNIVNHLTIPAIQIDKVSQDQKEFFIQKFSNLSEELADLKKEIIITNQSADLLSKRLKRVEREKEEIRTLLNLKQTIINQLKKTFAKSTLLNPNTGALVFASGDLFDKGDDTLHKDAEPITAEAFNSYMKVLMSNSEAKKYLQKIEVSGHTDSDGNLQYNIDLSKRRALFVSNYLAKLESIQTYHLTPLLTVTGYADRYKIMKNETEDKNSSRRIEIKFVLNDKQIEEDIKQLLISAKDKD